ncbi:MAG: adenylate/guanylate cyclase domain-containing protein [Burkholderiales bacterium]|nr:adenylate/guanylate cyclase domain-containing protein [Burkholderiales bacterium]
MEESKESEAVPAAAESSLFAISWWRRPGLRLRFAQVSSGFGLASTMAAAVLSLIHSAPEAQDARVTSHAFLIMDSIVDVVTWWACLIFAAVAGILGMYLAVRSSRHPLVALLATACSSACGGFGTFAFVFALMDADKRANYRLHEVFYPTFGPDWGAKLWIAALIVVLLLSLIWLLLWFAAMVAFYLAYPRPLKLEIAATQPNESIADQPFAGRVFKWSRLGGLAPPLGLMTLYVTFAFAIPWALNESTRSDILSAAPLSILFCFVPFLAAYLKRPHLLPAEQSAFNWLLLGQTATVLIFLSVALGLLVWWSEASFTATTAHRFMGMYINDIMLGLFVMVFHLVSLLAIAFALLSRGSVDPGLMVRRTWVIGFSAIATSLLFVVLERLAAGWLVRRLGLSSETALLVIGALVAASFFPIRHWSEGKIKLLFDRYLSPENFADGERATAAVVFSDLTGYSALAARNESEAHLTAALFHRSAKLHVASHAGRLVKTIGDAVMLTFPDANSALEATRTIHADYLTKAATVGTEPLQPHAGIHVGELILGEDGDVYGATVNIAARLQAVAKPGEIVLSGAARSELLETDLATPIGSLSLKNIPQPVEAYVTPG